MNHHFRKDNLGHEWTPWTLVVLRGPTPQVGHTPQVCPTPQGQNKVKKMSNQGHNIVRTRSE
jgi:hypothetical protein